MWGPIRSPVPKITGPISAAQAGVSPARERARRGAQVEMDVSRLEIPDRHLTRRGEDEWEKELGDTGERTAAIGRTRFEFLEKADMPIPEFDESAGSPFVSRYRWVLGKRLDVVQERRLGRE